MTPPTTEPGAPDPVLDDPMLRVLRERHPEVDIVVLPQPVPATEPDVAPLGRKQRDADADGIERLVDNLVARLSREPDWTGAQRFGQWRTNEWGQVSYDTAVEVGGLADGANVALLRAAGRALVGHGWEAEPVAGHRPRISASRPGGVTASLTVRPTSLVITCRGPFVQPVDDEDSR